ncbi:MAG: TonB-dependent receptor [Crocinitomicaceae bacterium]|nr:TonB-dependent receptor [Crocinitomicaceae bacterium]
MRFFLLFLLTFVVSVAGFGQNHNIRGFVFDKENGEPVTFEKVKLLNDGGTVVNGAMTDINGLFSIPSVAIGDYSIVIESTEFETINQKISVTKATGITELKFNLEKIQNIKEIEGVSITAEAQKNKTQIQVSKISMDKATIERIPTIGAENDIVNALSITPGVITTGDQGGQLYVRGGTPIQNKILLDGMTIYSPFHSIGFFSIFETELIRNTDIYTGGFDAKYGGRISSIMDITYRDGNRQKLSGKVSASPFMAKAVLEGPLGKKKVDGSPRMGSYILSAKHSLLSYTSKSLYKNINNMSTSSGAGMPYTFTDVYGKITLNGDAGTKFSVFAFHNRDSVNYSIADLSWQATGGGINFLLVPASSKTIIKGHLTGSYYKTSFKEAETQPRFSAVGGFDLAFDFSYFLQKESELTYGLNIGGFNTNFETYNEAKRKIENSNFSTEIGAYLSYRYVTTRWVVQPSFRLQAYPSIASVVPEPRLGLKFNATEFMRIKLSGGRYSQNFTSASSDKDIVNLFNGMLSAPSNIQSTFVNQYGKERSPKNGLQTAWHAVFGFEFDILKNLSLNIEGYYKFFDQLSNINQNKIYEDIPEFNNKADVEKKDFLIESGESYGVDFLLKYNLNNSFHLWTVYSLGYSTRWDGFVEYFPVFDRRHNLNIVASYAFGKKKNTEIDLRWNFGSGLPFTPTSGYYQPDNFSGGISTDYTTTNSSNVGVLLGTFNSSRLPAYHRLDLTIKHKFIFKNKMELELIASVVNLYNQKNIFYVNRVSNEVIYQFPILPSFGIGWKF